MTRKQLFENILLALVFTHAAMLCIMIPELSLEGGTKILFGSYIGLMILSSITKNHGIAVALILCAMALPIAEGIWQYCYYGWEDVENAIVKKELIFAPLGRISYLASLVIIPGMSLVIGDNIRIHRKYKPV